MAPALHGSDPSARVPPPFTALSTPILSGTPPSPHTFPPLNTPQVRSVPVTLSLTDLTDLALPPPRIREVSSVEASLRLDSILSAGLRLSRSKAADLVRQGSVRVNWRPVAKPSVELSAGDIISCSGKGRLVLRDAQPTAKGRWRVTMTQTV